MDRDELREGGMKIRRFPDISQQLFMAHGLVWSVSRLIALSRDFPVMDVPLDHLNVYYTYDKMSLREMLTHIQAVEEADLTYPIILDEDGEIMDGRHRVMAAILRKRKTIRAVRFDENPEPDKVEAA